MLEYILGFGSAVVLFNAGRILGGITALYIKATAPRESLRNELFKECFKEGCYIDENGVAQLLETIEPEFKTRCIQSRNGTATVQETADGWLVNCDISKRKTQQKIDFEVV